MFYTHSGNNNKIETYEPSRECARVNIINSIISPCTFIKEPEVHSVWILIHIFLFFHRLGCSKTDTTFRYTDKYPFRIRKGDNEPWIVRFQTASDKQPLFYKYRFYLSKWYPSEPSLYVCVCVVIAHTRHIMHACMCVCVYVVCVLYVNMCCLVHGCMCACYCFYSFIPFKLCTTCPTHIHIYSTLARHYTQDTHSHTDTYNQEYA